MATKIVVRGGQGWKDKSIVEASLLAAKQRFQEIEVIQGDSPSGADPLIAEVCASLDIPTTVVPADTNRWRGQAVRKRDEALVKDKPDECIVFASKDSTVTNEFIKAAYAAGIKTYVYTEKSVYVL